MKIKAIAVFSYIFIVQSALAMESLTDHALQNIDGQAGADLSLYLSLNHTTLPLATAAPQNLATYNPAITPQFDKNLCLFSALEYCRLAISLNNRTADANNMPLGTNMGRKQWVIFKGIQGTINIPKLGLDGSDVSYASVTNKAAIKLSFDREEPIQIRNFGFQSMSLETDSDIAANESASNFTAGYLRTDKYDKTIYGAFDGNNPAFVNPYSTDVDPNSTANASSVGREKGFLGVNMNTNLSIAGTIKIFSCAPSGGYAHPRCS